MKYLLLMAGVLGAFSAAYGAEKITASVIAQHDAHTISKAKCEVFTLPDSLSYAVCHTDHNGVFELQQPEGDWYIAISHPDYNDRLVTKEEHESWAKYAEEINSATHAPIVYTLQAKDDLANQVQETACQCDKARCDKASRDIAVTGPVRGIVVTDDGRHGISNAICEIFTEEGSIRFASAVTDAEGEFELPRPEGEWHIVISHKDYKSATIRRELHERQEQTVLSSSESSKSPIHYALPLK